MNSVYARLALETIAAAPIPGLAVCATLVATIVDSAKRAKHNKKLCKMLADCAERAHERIIRVQQSRLNSRAIDLYKESLDDTSQLMEKLQQPGLLYSLWRVLNSDEVCCRYNYIIIYRHVLLLMTPSHVYRSNPSFETLTIKWKRQYAKLLLI